MEVNMCLGSKHIPPLQPPAASLVSIFCTSIVNLFIILYRSTPPRFYLLTSADLTVVVMVLSDQQPSRGPPSTRHSLLAFHYPTLPFYFIISCSSVPDSRTVTPSYRSFPAASSYRSACAMGQCGLSLSTDRLGANMDTVRRGATPTNTKRTYSRCALGRTQRRGHYAPSSGLHLVAARCRFWRDRFHAATLLSPRRRLRHVVGKSVCSGRSRELLTEAAIRAPQSLGCDIRMCPTCVPPSSALKCLTRFLPVLRRRPLVRSALGTAGVSCVCTPLL